ncbi:MAG: 4Fe-4S dicluster domain-containing protein, partial [Candidatus Omnitrophica bacterium]|nr:4Fe-4S dicluster domain-containing protein [Candidatus Omnitrophota bacterium]
VRAFEPLKAFFSRAREVVAQGFSDAIPSSSSKPFAIVGVKACDLKGFKVQDSVFMPSDAQDPVYTRNRTANLVISADCTCSIETCFCLAMGVQPFPQENFDINLSRVANGYVVSVGSPKGETVVKMNSLLFEKAKPEAIAERDALRRGVVQSVEKNLRENNVPMETALPGKIQKNFHSDIWQDEAKTCVECGACNTICPTCHCFLLYDQKEGAGRADKTRMERFRIWDSCMIKDFARVAGNGNPRKALWMRLRNRFEKKFDFFPKVSGITACTGCGRCISACPAKIDIRR